MSSFAALYSYNPSAHPIKEIRKWIETHNEGFIPTKLLGKNVKSLWVGEANKLKTQLMAAYPAASGWETKSGKLPKASKRIEKPSRKHRRDTSSSEDEVEEKEEDEETQIEDETKKKKKKREKEKPAKKRIKKTHEDDEQSVKKKAVGKKKSGKRRRNEESENEKDEESVDIENENENECDVATTPPSSAELPRFKKKRKLIRKEKDKKKQRKEEEEEEEKEQEMEQEEEQAEERDVEDFSFDSMSVPESFASLNGAAQTNVFQPPPPSSFFSSPSFGPPNAEEWKERFGSSNKKTSKKKKRKEQDEVYEQHGYVHPGLFSPSPSASSPSSRLSFAPDWTGRLASKKEEERQEAEEKQTEERERRRRKKQKNKNKQDDSENENENAKQKGKSYHIEIICILVLAYIYFQTFDYGWLPFTYGSSIIQAILASFTKDSYYFCSTLPNIRNPLDLQANATVHEPYNVSQLSPDGLLCTPCPLHGYCFNGQLTCDAPFYKQHRDLCIERNDGFQVADHLKKRAIYELQKALGLQQCGYIDDIYVIDSSSFSSSSSSSSHEKDNVRYNETAHWTRQQLFDFFYQECKQGQLSSLCLPFMESRVELDNTLKNELDHDIIPHILNDRTFLDCIKVATIKESTYYTALHPVLWVSCWIKLACANFYWLIIGWSLFALFGILTYREYRVSKEANQVVKVLIERIKTSAEPLAIEHLRDELQMAERKRVWASALQSLNQDSRIQFSKQKKGAVSRECVQWTASSSSSLSSSSASPIHPSLSPFNHPGYRNFTDPPSSSIDFSSGSISPRVKTPGDRSPQHDPHQQTFASSSLF